MAYWFSGIFADGDEQVMNALLQEYSGIGRLIVDPFKGFGVLFTGNESEGPLPAAGSPLVHWSTSFPETTFVYLYVECFGGDCDHAGFVFRGGKLLHEEEFEEGDAPLRRLLGFLGIELNERGVFPPLRRGYFEPQTGS